MKKVFVYIVVGVVSLFLISAIASAWYIVRVGFPIFFNPSRIAAIATHAVSQQLSADAKTTSALQILQQKIVSRSEPYTVLLLFLNNTELRPGGGFIGSYAVLRIHKDAAPELLVVEGSERLDARASAVLPELPPSILTQELGVTKWFFRDSNWFAGFPENAQQVLRAYRIEGGLAAENIDMVAAITPDVLVRVMDAVGSVTIDGITFTSSTVVQTLQYDVEYGYEQRDISFADRKKIMQPLAQEILSRLARGSVTHAHEYIILAQQLVAEKHIIAYALDAEIQDAMHTLGMTGDVRLSSGDYIQWVDANLAALKTDRVIQRSLNYSVDLSRRTATATMTYVHSGSFDWRTSRYRTFARVYVPKGSTLIRAAMQKDSVKASEEVKKDLIYAGEESGLQWFGVFFVVEPKKTGTVQFVYTLPEMAVKNNPYVLRVQKQLGLPSLGLTVRAKLGTTSIQSAMPAEDTNQWGDSEYVWSGIVAKDMDLVVNTK